MRRPFLLFAVFLAMTTSPRLHAQDVECTVTTSTEALTTEAREKLIDFASQVQQYVNSFRWVNEDLRGEKIICSINISFQGSPRDDWYTVQAFVGSQRPVFKGNRNSALLRILDDKWEFNYVKYTPLTHVDQRYDPLLSFVDYYINLIIGYDFDSYHAGDGTPYFQKALEISNRARGSGKGWDATDQTAFSRGALVDELINPKFRELREAMYKYHYRGLDLLYKDETKARKNVLTALQNIGKLQFKINQRSHAIRIFFDTKYLEIAELFLKESDPSVYPELGRIDPVHQQTYNEYSKKPRQ